MRMKLYNAVAIILLTVALVAGWLAVIAWAGAGLEQTEVNPIGSNTVVAGTAALTTVAAPISATTIPVRELLIQCDVANLVDCYLGNATTQTVHLAPGQSLSIPVANLQLLYSRTASSTATLNYLGRK